MQRFPVLRSALATLALVACVAAFPLAAGAAEGLRVNVNTADAQQLALLPRVGPAVAERILAFRDENGPFESLDELMLVRGIGEKTFELIEPWASTDGPTTLTEKVASTDTEE